MNKKSKVYPPTFLESRRCNPWMNGQTISQSEKSPKAACKGGRVYIVGAGPGSAQLISVRGLQILQQADCILYDRLIGKELLSFVPREAELVCVGKDRTECPPKQEDINRLIIEKARTCKTVVRLKGGDPMIFGRATEELKCLADNGIDFEIIPGITAASAAAACGGVVLTDRNTASSVTFVTGQTAEGKKVEDIDFDSLVKLNGTIVFYMTVKNMNKICQRLISSGLSADTGAIVVADASLPGQKIIKGTVSDIAEKCAQKNIEPPAVMIIGKTCFSWFENLPLFGKKVLITRDSAGNADFASRLAVRGAEAVDYPAFKIVDLTDTGEFEQIIEEVKNFDWVFFTSATGVRLFFESAGKLNKDARILAGTNVACIGAQTAQSLEDFGIKPDFMPAVFTARELAAGFIKKYSPAGRKILLLRSAIATSELAEKLESAGAEVRQVAVYTAEKLKNNPAEISEQLRQGKIDWIAFASSFAVECFFEDFDPKDINKKIKIASIGPATANTLKKFGITPAVEAAEHTIDGLIEAMEEIESEKN
jgi:uroporphyrinogen III methyltransferase/synthase